VKGNRVVLSWGCSLVSTVPKLVCSRRSVDVLRVDKVGSSESEIADTAALDDFCCCFVANKTHATDKVVGFSCCNKLSFRILGSVMVVIGLEYLTSGYKVQNVMAIDARERQSRSHQRGSSTKGILAFIVLNVVGLL
jgi:hypothetical protein